MQSSCLELEERRKVEETRLESSCLKLEEVLKKQGCKAVA